MDRLIVLSRDPLNAEAPLDELSGIVTEAGTHFVRTHFAIPEGPARLVVDGAVRSPLTLGPADLRAMERRSLLVTLECAGNGRAYLDPPVAGEPWRLGAVGTAEWTGVPLRAVLDRAGPGERAVEILCRGADEGTPEGLGRRIAFERSLPIEDARAEGVLVAYEMNGAPLPREHGAPLRLIVPGRYGMASVKWLAALRVIEEPFRGFFQSDRYVLDGRPLGPIEPRAVIVAPAAGSRLPAGPALVRGYAWSGRGPVSSVAVSPDGGRSWRDATLGPAASPHAWREWRIELRLETGRADLLAVATDPAGRRQPTEQRRDPLGYANNAAQPVRLQVS